MTLGMAKLRSLQWQMRFSRFAAALTRPSPSPHCKPPELQHQRKKAYREPYSMKLPLKTMFLLSEVAATLPSQGLAPVLRCCGGLATLAMLGTLSGAFGQLAIVMPLCSSSAFLSQKPGGAGRGGGGGLCHVHRGASTARAGPGNGKRRLLEEGANGAKRCEALHRGAAAAPGAPGTAPGQSEKTLEVRCEGRCEGLRDQGLWSLRVGRQPLTESDWALQSQVRAKRPQGERAELRVLRGAAADFARHHL